MVAQRVPVSQVRLGVRGDCENRDLAVLGEAARACRGRDGRLLMVHIDADTSEPGVVRLYVYGQLDLLAASAFREAFAWAARLRRPVEVDLDRIDFIDGSGLNMLMEARRRALSAGRRLTIVGASRCVRRLIEITNTADSLPLLPRGQVSRRMSAERRKIARPSTAEDIRPEGMRWRSEHERYRPQTTY
jgi:anti-anti-sigma factor